MDPSDRRSRPMSVTIRDRPPRLASRPRASRAPARSPTRPWSTSSAGAHGRPSSSAAADASRSPGAGRPDRHGVGPDLGFAARRVPGVSRLHARHEEAATGPASAVLAVAGCRGQDGRRLDAVEARTGVVQYGGALRTARGRELRARLARTSAGCRVQVSIAPLGGLITGDGPVRRQLPRQPMNAPTEPRPLMDPRRERLPRRRRVGGRPVRAGRDPRAGQHPAQLDRGPLTYPGATHPERNSRLCWSAKPAGIFRFRRAAGGGATCRRHIREMWQRSRWSSGVFLVLFIVAVMLGSPVR